MACRRRLASTSQWSVDCRRSWHYCPHLCGHPVFDLHDILLHSTSTDIATSRQRRSSVRLREAVWRGGSDTVTTGLRWPHDTTSFSTTIQRGRLHWQAARLRGRVTDERPVCIQTSQQHCGRSACVLSLWIQHLTWRSFSNYWQVLLHFWKRKGALVMKTDFWTPADVIGLQHVLLLLLTLYYFFIWYLSTGLFYRWVKHDDYYFCHVGDHFVLLCLWEGLLISYPFLGWIFEHWRQRAVVKGMWRIPVLRFTNQERVNPVGMERAGLVPLLGGPRMLLFWFYLREHSKARPTQRRYYTTRRVIRHWYVTGTEEQQLQKISCWTDK